MASSPLTIREQVTNRIRDDVVAGNFPPDQPLREAELARRLGVSRGPVRDAFLTLSQEGLLAYQANRGVRVRRPPDPEHRTFIVSLRRQIECYIVGRGFGAMRGGALGPVEAALDELEAACAGRDVGRVARYDVAFHEAILVACGSSEFLPAWKWLCSQMMLTYTRLDDYRDVFEEHLRIARAIRDGRKQACLAALKANLQ